VFVGGLTLEWESEGDFYFFSSLSSTLIAGSKGFDRPTLDMPGRQDELIRQLGKANPDTVVVLQSVGSRPCSSACDC